MKLHLADNLALPIEAVTQTFAILAKRGMGKSYAGAVIAEEMLKADQPVIIIDPTGAHWGLRAAANKKDPGFPVVVFGGEHGDLPLEEHAGEIIAKAIVDNRFPAVIDLSLFRKGQVTRFMGAFAEALYRLNRQALHLIVDEADAIAPQRPFGEEARTLGAMEDIVRRGRIRGIGCTLITQRPSVLNKNVLTQTESLFVFRMTHPRDIDAMMEWVGVHATDEEAEKVRADLPIMPVGTCWFWSPGWMNTLKKIAIRARETFDSSATPKPGEHVKAPKELAAVDLTKLGDKIQEAARQAKENDPRELKRRLAELEKQLKGRPVEIAEPVEVRVEVPVLKNGQLDRTEKILARVEKWGTEALAEVAELRRLILPAVAVGVGRAVGVLPKPIAKPAPAQPRPAPQPRPTPRQATEAHGEVGSGGLQRMLIALAQRANGLSAKQLGVRAGMSSSSGTFGTYLGKARAAGWIDGGRDLMRITTQGLEALGAYEPLPTGGDLLAYWLRELGDSGAARMLEAAASAYPRSLSKEQLAEASGMSASSGTFGTYLGKLRTLELIEGRGELRASEELFQ